jgi:hypothetical protein
MKFKFDEQNNRIENKIIYNKQSPFLSPLGGGGGGF